MFDFSELLIIFVLALVVLGPKKLPGVAAQVGRWLGRARAMARQFREQLEQEVASAESALDVNAPRESTPKPADPSIAPGHAPAEPAPHADSHAGTEAGAETAHPPFATGLPWVDDPAPPTPPATPPAPQTEQPGTSAAPHDDSRPSDGSGHERAT
jgi:sec-independent protein translocase protein TatB